MNYKCFLIEPTDREKLFLRRYRSSETQCPGCHGYHTARIFLCEGRLGLTIAEPPHDDPRWPTQCDCGYRFTPDDEWQLFDETIWRRVDTGEEMTLAEAPIGAMWDAYWFKDCPALVGPDGKSYVIKMPGGGEWQIDSRCSNCDSPCKHCGRPYHQHGAQCCEKGYEDARPHKCWVRHGIAPILTVDKNGVTCGAGAGSIWMGYGTKNPGWHGFLRNGVLEPC